MDRQKTKYTLADALMRLLEKKSFRKISVGDICQEASVSRSAFYLYFRDKYELLRFCVAGTLQRQDGLAKGEPIERRLILLLESAQSSQRMLRNAFEADCSQELIEIFSDTFREYISGHLERVGGADRFVTEHRRMVAAFLSGGIANMMIDWIRDRFQTPLEEVARGQCELIRRTLGDIRTEDEEQRLR